MGGVPRFVEPTIAPGIDITQFLLLNREEVRQTVNVSTITSGGGTNVQVPAGELWYVHVLQVNSYDALVAAETIQVQPGYIGQLRFFGVGDSVRATAGQRASSASWNGFWAAPGSILAVRINEITTATTIRVDIDANITRLRI